MCIDFRQSAECQETGWVGGGSVWDLQTWETNWQRVNTSPPFEYHVLATHCTIQCPQFKSMALTLSLSTTYQWDSMHTTERLKCSIPELAHGGYWLAGWLGLLLIHWFHLYCPPTALCSSYLSFPAQYSVRRSLEILESSLKMSIVVSCRQMVATIGGLRSNFLSGHYCWVAVVHVVIIVLSSFVHQSLCGCYSSHTQSHQIGSAMSVE